MRLGAFATAVAGLVPAALATLPRDLVVTVREGTTPTLTRALRAGTLDLAVLAQTPPFRPPDAESPPLELTPLAERELVVAVGPRHPFAGARAVEVARARGPGLGGERSDAGDALLGVWPGLAERPDVRYVVRDWLAKLQIVAAGLAITTLAAGGGRRAARRACTSSRCAASRRRRGGWCSRACPGRSAAPAAAVADALLGHYL